MPVGSGWEVPPDVRDRVEFHWFHVPISGGLVLCVLSAAPVWYVGHFTGGRMRECSGPQCEACKAGQGTQLRYVISVVDVSTHQIGVLEVGQAVAMVLRQWTSGLGYLRGMMIEVTRATKSKHSRMEVAMIKEICPHWCQAVEGLPLEEVLERTWDRQSPL